MSTYFARYFGLNPTGFEVMFEVSVSSPRSIPQEDYVVWRCDVRANILGTWRIVEETGLSSIEALTKGVLTALECEQSFLNQATKEIYYTDDADEDPFTMQDVEQLRSLMDSRRQRRIRMLLEMALILSRPVPNPFD